ncbi:type VI secretion system-associated FHA domain protein [Segnochrobactrum spirostomi]|uniref:FHA domain-containing protein n=1 Tax=Segnochrobactrum spirostomi TaxID=2608987 RepID=A0A6A7YAN7_9HYPH|nr:FHA domain-containing protein [Segnochrobactrum spirostomi]MQT15068.1 FHA domain-containing protein [Segnochrobactrum spirostomi]
MKVRLSAIGDNPGDGGLRQQWVFGETGGSIGRSPSCDWTLADPNNTLSGRHALIGFANGAFTITDISTNGVYINTVSSPLGRGRTAPLREGDILYLGPYALKVELVQEGGAQRAASRPQQNFGLDSPAVGSDTAPVLPPTPRPSFAGEPLMPAPARAPGQPSAPQAGRTDLLSSNAPLADLFQPPAPRSSSLLSDTLPPTPRQPAPTGGWDQSGIARRDDPLAALQPRHPPGESGLHGLAAVEAALFGSLPPIPSSVPPPFPNNIQPPGAPARPSAAIPTGAPALKPPSGAPPANVVRTGGIDIPLDFLEGLTATFDAKPQPAPSAAAARTFAPPPPFAPQPSFAPPPQPLPPQGFPPQAFPAQSAPPQAFSPTPDGRTSAAPMDPREAAVRAALRASVGQLLGRIAPDEISRSLSHTAPLLTGPEPAALWERYCTLYRELLAGLDTTLPQIIGSAFSDASEVLPADTSRFR